MQEGKNHPCPTDRWKPAAGQLRAADYDFGRLKAILLTHAHWDHMSGLSDFPGLPVMVTARDKAFFDNSKALGRLGPPSFGPPFTETPFNWQVFDFEGRTVPRLRPQPRRLR